MSAVCLVGVLHLGYVVVVLMGWDGGRGSQRGMETAADERTCGEGGEQTKSACVCLGAVRLCVCVCVQAVCSSEGDVCHGHIHHVRPTVLRTAGDPVAAAAATFER